MNFDKNEIAKKLDERKAYLPCARCGNKAFSIGDGFGMFDVQQTYGNGNIMMGGPHIPVFYIICNNCGAVTPHALGALDMMPKPEPIKTPPDKSTPMPTPDKTGGNNG